MVLVGCLYRKVPLLGPRGVMTGGGPVWSAGFSRTCGATVCPGWLSRAGGATHLRAPALRVRDYVRSAGETGYQRGCCEALTYAGTDGGGACRCHVLSLHLVEAC